MNLREKFYRFMQGRYGTDAFGRFTMGMALVCIVISMFIPQYVIRSAVDYTGIAILVYSYYRIFSKDYAKRSAENRTYLEKTSSIRNWFGKQKYMWNQKKQYHIYACPECKQKIRIPKGRGKIEIQCPKCGTTFRKKS